MTVTQPILMMITTITRLACIGYVIIIGFTIPEVWNLLQDDSTVYMIEGTTLYVPLETCQPLSIQVDVYNASSTSSNNTTLTFDSSTTPATTNCHSLEYFLNASVASMFFVAIAILLFILFDMMARYCKKGPITRSSVVGMSIFLAFMLIQASASSYAIYQEIQRWTQFYESRLDTLQRSEITNVSTYADKFFFYLTSLVGVITAGLLLLDTLLAFCLGDASSSNSKQNNDIASVAGVASTATTVGHSNQSTMMGTNNNNDANDENDVATNDDDDEEKAPNPKSWTSY